MATPELLQRYPGAHYVQTKEQNKMISKVILILKRVSLTVRLQTLAPLTLTTAVSRQFLQYNSEKTQ